MISLKKRADLYEKEATELIRVTSTYKALLLQQIYMLFPGKESKIEQLLRLYIKQQRLFYEENTGLVYYQKGLQANNIVISCFWVLLDFIEQVKFHTLADNPVCICFYAKEAIYEIVYVSNEAENIMNQLFHQVEEKNNGKRIIVVENEVQIPKIQIKNIAGYCTVAKDGHITYYQFK